MFQLRRWKKPAFRKKRGCWKKTRTIGTSGNRDIGFTVRQITVANPSLARIGKLPEIELQNPFRSMSSVVTVGKVLLFRSPDHPITLFRDACYNLSHHPPLRVQGKT